MFRKMITRSQSESPPTKKKRNLSTSHDQHESKENSIKKKKIECVNEGKKKRSPASLTVIECVNEGKKKRSPASLTVVKTSTRKTSAAAAPTVNCTHHKSEGKKLKPNCLSDSVTLDNLKVEGIYGNLEKYSCVICMDTKKSRTLERLACGHSFHSMCIKNWLQLKEECPVCMPISNHTSSTYMYDNMSNFYEDSLCTICLDTVECVDFEQISCGHSFHVICIQTWYGVKEICPVCMEVSTIDDHFTIDDIYQFQEDLVCMICLGTEVSDHLFSEISSCGHRFHSMCLQRLCEAKGSCPICIEYISPNETWDSFREGQCVICLNTVETSDFQFLPCDHGFHSICIQNWFQISESCPICMPTFNTTEGNYSTGNQCVLCTNTEESEFEYVKCVLNNDIWHSFHSKCIETWFQDNQSCPICEPDFSTNSNLNVSEENDSQIVRCAICVDTEEYSDFEFLKCCHSFHVECIRKWLKVKKNCPMCNTVISVGRNSQLLNESGGMCMMTV